MFLTLTIENNRPVLVNSSQVAAINQSYRLMPDSTRPGGSVRVPSGCLIELSNGTRITVLESLESLEDALDSSPLIARRDLTLAVDTPTATAQTSEGTSKETSKEGVEGVPAKVSAVVPSSRPARSKARG